jgi:hypothetical protein
MLSALQMAIAWIGIVPFRTPGKKDKPLHDVGVGGRQRRKSPVRRCFKSCPPFGGVHRFAPAAGFYGRLTGLLSRSPPTDTRPQARAIWARRKIITFSSITSVFFNQTASRAKYLQQSCRKDSPHDRHILPLLCSRRFGLMDGLLMQGEALFTPRYRGNERARGWLLRELAVSRKGD